MLSLEYGIDVPLKRPDSDFGEKTWPVVNPALRVAYKLNTPVKVRTDAGGEAWTQTGLLYVYRTAEVKDGDKVTLPEGDYIVFGPAENDMLQPQDGTDFGVKRLNIERG